jgi:hypothetical protein
MVAVKVLNTAAQFFQVTDLAVREGCTRKRINAHLEAIVILYISHQGIQVLWLEKHRCTKRYQKSCVMIWKQVFPRATSLSVQNRHRFTVGDAIRKLLGGRMWSRETRNGPNLKKNSQISKTSFIFKSPTLHGITRFQKVKSKDTK